MYPEIREKNVICTPSSHNGTPFLMCHKAQGTQHFITLTQTLDSEKCDWDSIFGGHVDRWTPYFRGTSQTLVCM